MTIELVYPNTHVEIEKFQQRFNKRELFNVSEYSLIDKSGQKCRQMMRSDKDFVHGERGYYVIDPTSTNRELLLDNKKRAIPTMAHELSYTTKNGVTTKIELKGVQYLNVVNPIVIFSQSSEAALDQRAAMTATKTKVSRAKETVS